MVNFQFFILVFDLIPNFFFICFSLFDFKSHVIQLEEHKGSQSESGTQKQNVVKNHFFFLYLY